MTNFNIKHSLQGLGRIAMHDPIDQRIKRSCIGRIVNALTGIFILICLLVVIMLSLFVNESGVIDNLPDFVGSILSALIIVGFIGAIVIAGLLGSFLRRRLWHLLRMRRRPY